MLALAVIVRGLRHGHLGRRSAVRHLRRRRRHRHRSGDPDRTAHPAQHRAAGHRGASFVAIFSLRGPVPGHHRRRGTVRLGRWSGPAGLVPRRRSPRRPCRRRTGRSCCPMTSASTAPASATRPSRRNGLRGRVAGPGPGPRRRAGQRERVRPGGGAVLEERRDHLRRCLRGARLHRATGGPAVRVDQPSGHDRRPRPRRSHTRTADHGGRVRRIPRRLQQPRLRCPRCSPERSARC